MTSETSSICAICNDSATGKHFGAISCRACAAFFRRAIIFDLNFKCKKNSDCLFDKDAKAICKGCRLKKCHDVGMDPRYVQRNRDEIGPRKNQNRTTSDPSISQSPPDSLPGPSSSSTSGFGDQSTPSCSNFIDYAQEKHQFYASLGLKYDGISTPLLEEYAKGYKNYKSLQKAAQMAYGNGTKLVEAVYPEHTFLRPDNYAFLSQIVQKHFLPTNKLSKETTEDLIKKFFPYFCATDVSLLTIQHFPDKNDNRLMLTLTHYTGADRFYHFFKIPETTPVPPMIINGFVDILTRSRLLFMQPLQELDLSIEEIAGLLGVVFWTENHATNATEYEQNLIRESRDALFDELYLMTQSRVSNLQQAGLRFTKICDLIPISTSVLDELKVHEAFCSLYGGVAASEFEKEMLPHAF